MVRMLTHNAYSVYVHSEKGHQRPHAHINHPTGGTRLGSVFLLTLEYFQEVGKIPKDVKNLIEENQAELLAKWEELNDA